MSVQPEPHSSPDVRTQLLESATRRFAEDGFAATSLQRIADDVGIRKPSLLYHFPSKEALRQAVLERLFSHWNEALPRLLMAATGSQDRFEAVITEVVDFFVDDPNRARLLLREMMDRPEDLEPLIARYLDPWLKVISGYIRESQAEGLVHRGVDPEAFLLQIIQLIVGGIATAQVFGHALGDGGAPEEAMRRQKRELLRVAKASFFARKSG